MGPRRHPRSSRPRTLLTAAAAVALAVSLAGIAFAGCGGSDSLGGGGGDAQVDPGDTSDGGGNGVSSLSDASDDAALADGPHYDHSLIVPTSLGPVQGALDLGVPSFRGIPYAAPPVGDLRWSAPVPPDGWTTPRDATSFTSSCIQLDTDGDLLPGGSEDCLTLNIWTPSGELDAGSKLPVLAFIHGGYFVKGGATYTWHDELVYDGAALAAFSNAVVVTIQYRLGAFGFLAHPSLSSDSAPHGNYGLLDQVAALDFVRANIGQFGGDSTNVTIFGQSSGGSSVAALLASPLAAGLFSRAIIESGGFSAYSVATGTSDATIVANALGCGAATDIAGCLRAKDASDVAVSLPDSALGPARWHFLADGYSLPDDPLSQFAAGAWNKVPVILGTNRDELSAMVYDYLRAANLPTPTNQTTYESDVAALYPQNTSAVLENYPYSAYTTSPVSGLAQLLGDDQYTCPTRQAARALAASGQPIFRYLFVHSLDPADYTDGGGGNSVLGAYHFLEVPFVFHAMAPTDFVFSSDEYGLSSQMIDLWGSFAKDGAPSAPGVTWPLYPAAASTATGDADAGAGGGGDAGDGGVTAPTVAPDPYLAIDVRSVAGDGVRTTFCDFWDSQQGQALR